MTERETAAIAAVSPADGLPAATPIIPPDAALEATDQFVRLVEEYLG